ncbi:MAG: NFACT family protein, partial [Clostridia bacterium]
MALDGAFLRHIKKELEEKLIDGRVDKVYQPSRDEIVLQIRTRQDTYKLLLSARPDTARIQITKFAFENP